ncbi:MAG TPA: hypothetical protein VGR27_14725, partial [Longimicrobiaceae bacterium]|nr:hypothetical protein [Longimicrobiaceae bacterium]
MVGRIAAGRCGAELLSLERTLGEQGLHLLAGVDEVGRGPLAGPVVAAAVIMPPGLQLDGVDDSKRLSARRRQELSERILRAAIAVGAGAASRREIDRLDIRRAT